MTTTKCKKRGFTLVELLVVIAILAILATVSIVGYTSFINKANKSADEAAVTQINTLLEALDVEDEPKDLNALFTYLAEAGLNAEDYKPLVNDTYFYWDEQLNRILYLDAENNVLYPEQYTDTDISSHNLFSLTGTIPDDGNEVTFNDGAATVTSATQFVSAQAMLSDSSMAKLTLSSDVDCKGASVTPSKCNNNNVTIGGTSDESKVTLKNVISSDFYQQGQGNHPGKGYNASLFFAEIGSGKSVTIENLVIENVTVGNYETGSSGIICGELLGGTLTVKNVTFKNCTIYGMNKVGIIVGYVQNGTVNIENVTIEGCKVYSSEGEAAIAIGVYNEKHNGTVNTIKVSNLTCTNNTVSIVVDEYHDLVTASDGTKYITKIDDYDTARTAKAAGNEYREIKTIENTTCWRLCVAAEGVLAWKATGSDAKVDGVTFSSSAASSAITACCCGQRTAITDASNLNQAPES